MFAIDQQTLNDIGISRSLSSSVSIFFEGIITSGGVQRLYDYVKMPLCDQKNIHARQTAILFLTRNTADHLFEKYLYADFERYLSLDKVPYSDFHLLSYLDFFPSFNPLEKRKRLFFIKRTICDLANFITRVHHYFLSLEARGGDMGSIKNLKETFFSLTTCFDLDELRRLSLDKISRKQIAKYDYLFRNVHKTKINAILSTLYDLDALNSVAKVLSKGRFSLPHFHEKEDMDHIVEIEQAYHPLLANAVKNDISIHKDKNIWFLTGANMTGKSTLLKTIALCVYLAHLGFPVPAEKMKTSLFKGILTTINLGDDIVSGFSHFFNEVNRVRNIANRLNGRDRFLIMFDELFKGTHYQDAREATLELIESLSHIKKSTFFISSHITEIGEFLKNKNNIDLKHLQTDVSERDPIFTYTLSDGIATDRLGMWILRKEKVFDTLKSIK